MVVIHIIAALVHIMAAEALPGIVVADMILIMVHIMGVEALPAIAVADMIVVAAVDAIVAAAAAK